MHTPTPVPLPDRRPVARVDVVTVPRHGVFGRVRTYHGRTIATTATYPIGCSERVRALAVECALAHGMRVRP